jgi:hypothetical protein
VKLRVAADESAKSSDVADVGMLRTNVWAPEPAVLYQRYDSPRTAIDPDSAQIDAGSDGGVDRDCAEQRRAPRARRARDLGAARAAREDDRKREEEPDPIESWLRFLAELMAGEFVEETRARR